MTENREGRRGVHRVAVCGFSELSRVLSQCAAPFLSRLAHTSRTSLDSDQNAEDNEIIKEKKSGSES
ncbi:hypothetical protein E2C01_076908 [Portunus trituberculatus]|uniref:Uncharacterized protein n=1 Tax=Portunus trituberculatus TaxID=210409 RepID=A0A5B7IIX7_PORTR|nr:hypothetical protein [Portunus trituberculatus]